MHPNQAPKQDKKKKEGEKPKGKGWQLIDLGDIGGPKENKIDHEEQDGGRQDPKE